MAVTTIACGGAATACPIAQLFPVVSVGLDSTNSDFPVFSNGYLKDDSNKLKQQTYSINQGLVNCSFSHAKQLEERREGVIEKMRLQASLGYMAGTCFLIAGETANKLASSVARCMARQFREQSVMRACFNAMVMHPYLPGDTSCEQAIDTHDYPAEMRRSVLQGCNAFSVPHPYPADNGAFAAEAAKFAAKFPLSDSLWEKRN